MGTAVYSCGCSVTSSMYGEHKILGVKLCVWHNYLYDEDKTPKTLAKEVYEFDRSANYCWCWCHLKSNETTFVEGCNNCGHVESDGVYEEHFWIAHNVDPNKQWGTSWLP